MKGTIQAWPVGHPDPDTGEIFFAVDESYAELDRQGDFWSVVAKDGRRLLVPICAAVIIQPEEAVEPIAAESATVYTCDCGETYTRKVDVAVCAMRDSAGEGWPEGSDCKQCGYPLPLHVNGLSGVGSCDLVTGETVPAHHQYLSTLPLEV